MEEMALYVGLEQCSATMFDGQRRRNVLSTSVLLFPSDDDLQRNYTLKATTEHSRAGRKKYQKQLLPFVDQMCLENILNAIHFALENRPGFAAGMLKLYFN